MANPSWFIENDYLASKLKQLQDSGNTQFTSIVQVRAAIEGAGFTLLDHFNAYGALELTSPNANFNAKEYLEAKAKALGGTWTADTVADAFYQANLSPWQHYHQHGDAEGINPSNAFDTNAYYASKVALLNASGPTIPWTVESLRTYFQENGLDAISHYQAYGQAEGIVVTPVPEADRVPSDISGKTFTLTAGADNIVGTAGNDIINGVVDGAGVGNITTLSAIDTINGGAGNDTLNITATANAAGDVLNSAQITNVEAVNVRALANVSLDASQVVGLKSVNADKATAILTVTNLASGASAGMVGNGVVANGTLNAGYVAAATDAVVNISGGTTAGAVVITGTGLTSATVNSTGAANTIGALTGAATTTSTTIDAATNLTTAAVTNAGATLTIKGAGAVNLSAAALEAGVTKVDASGNTGGVTVALGTAVTQTVTGGSGNDVITSGAVLTTGSVNAGEGRDTLVLGTNVAHANTAALAAKYTNFEVLRLQGTFDASLIAGIEAIELSGATNNISKMSAIQAANVTARADIGATTLALATATGTADVLSLTMGTGLTNSAATNAGALTINGFETLNVKTNAGATATAGANKITTIASFNADSLTAINLTGTAVTLGNAATTKAVTIDATALTGNGAATPVGLTISGDLVAGSVVKGATAVGNTFNLSTVVGSSYTGGNGNDAFNITAVGHLRNGATYNKIDGGAGEDTLTLTAGGAAVTMVDDDFKEIANVEKLVVTNTGTNDISITTGGWYDASFKAAGSDVSITAAGTAGVSFTGGTFSGNQTLTISTAANTQNVAVLTGSGNDTVKITATAVTTGDITVATGVGSDAIEVDFGASSTLVTGAVVTLNGGAGKDTIKLDNLAAAEAEFVTVVTNAGDSTISAYDSITGFNLGGTAQSVLLDFTGTATVAANQAAASITGYTAAELTYTIANGFMTFAGSKASALTLDEKINLLDTLVTADLSTAALVHGGNTYVYNENAAGDSLIELVGVSTATALSAGGTTLATDINIA